MHMANLTFAELDSTFGTVGLSTGLSPDLTGIGKVIVSILKSWRSI
ncbi:MAG: hypothetical protein MAG551_00732 [Candidatus Scalindua arabica]|uniref:Uncharacterized protein n=1 Tax=Candidatus Scalindua arabica TaxID=1127984 RepID=A0A942A476_9BACT|nr:hypothetical protein [Candidatus Scalindua arabica]